jgi:hypothetical protein
MKTQLIPTRNNRYNDGIESDVVVVVNGRRHKVGGWGKGQAKRLEFEGPMVDGPVAYVFELCVAITSHVEADKFANDVTMELGDQLVVDGLLYEIVADGRFGHIKLVAVPSDPTQLVIDEAARKSGDAFVNYEHGQGFKVNFSSRDMSARIEYSARNEEALAELFARLGITSVLCSSDVDYALADHGYNANKAVVKALINLPKAVR